MPFTELGKFPFLTGLLSVFTMKRCWMLLNALSVSFESQMIMGFLSFICVAVLFSVGVYSILFYICYLMFH